MPTEYFFISDMHIGGDGELQNCDFEVELIDFLKQLERKHGAELIINGDAFGLWEFTTLEGTEKLEALIKQQPRLFEQFRKTGEKVPITLMPGKRSLSFKNNVHSKFGQELFGHASVTITLDTYSHLLPGMGGEAAGT